MTNNTEYYKKYLKYKSKYLKLKELLGGVDPAQFYPNPSSEILHQVNKDKLNRLCRIISNLLTDMILYNICQKLDVDYSNKLIVSKIEKAANYGLITINSLHIKENLRETLFDYVNYLIFKSTRFTFTTKADSKKMPILTVKLWELDSIYTDQFETNIHISFGKLGESPLDYHLTYGYKKRYGGEYVPHRRSGVEPDIFAELRYWLYVIKSKEKLHQYILPLIILSLLAINFGVNDDSRNTLDNILMEARKNNILSNFVKELFNYIPDLKEIYNIDNIDKLIDFKFADNFLDGSGKSVEEVLTKLEEISAENERKMKPKVGKKK